jgi:hypothetical protein
MQALAVFPECRKVEMIDAPLPDLQRPTEFLLKVRSL